MTTLAIEPEDLAIVQDILAAHTPPGTRVFVYGSRANGRPYRRGSDLDLSIDAGRKLAGLVVAEMKDAFTDSMLPYAVDVHDRHAADPAFLARIEADLVALPMPGPEDQQEGRCAA